MPLDMEEASPLLRLNNSESFPPCASLCGSSGAEHNHQVAVDAGRSEYEAEAWNDQARGENDFLEVRRSFDAIAHCLEPPVDTIMNESLPCGSLHPANELDDSFPSKRVAIDRTSPDPSNEEIDIAERLSDVNAETSKRKKLGSSSSPSNGHCQVGSTTKKARKRPVNVWAKTSTRKGSKRNSKNSSQTIAKNVRVENVSKQDHVCISLASKHQVNVEDGPGLPVVLSEFHKAEKIQLSDDKLSASSTKGYRMVRATRGVVEGAWYFEVLVKNVGNSGHTRLGWCTQNGEIQAPVGFDNHSYAYRDLDGSKVHKAVREQYGQLYTQGDVIGFYINLPNGAELAPKPTSIVSYRGQPYILEEKEDLPVILPGSEITFFKNGVCQGTAFKDINAGRYFPAASMYTLPNDPDCVVTFHFGPNFRFPPRDIGERPMPQPMAFAPYCGLDTFGFGSIGWKTETSGLDSCTPEADRTGEARLFT